MTLHSRKQRELQVFLPLGLGTWGPTDSLAVHLWRWQEAASSPQSLTWTHTPALWILVQWKPVSISVLQLAEQSQRHQERPTPDVEPADTDFWNIYGVREANSVSVADLRGSALSAVTELSWRLRLPRYWERWRKRQIAGEIVVLPSKLLFRQGEIESEDWAFFSFCKVSFIGVELC